LRPEFSWKNPLKKDRKGKIKNLSFKSQTSVIGRIEGDGNMEGHVYRWNVAHCSNAIKIKKVSCKTGKT